MNNSLPGKQPEIGRTVEAILKRFNTWDTKIVDLLAVDEPGINWRIVENGSTLSPGWEVIYWEYYG